MPIGLTRAFTPGIDCAHRLDLLADIIGRLRPLLLRHQRDVQSPTSCWRLSDQSLARYADVDERPSSPPASPAQRRSICSCTWFVVLQRRARRKLQRYCELATIRLRDKLEADDSRDAKQSERCEEASRMRRKSDSRCPHASVRRCSSRACRYTIRSDDRTCRSNQSPKRPISDFFVRCSQLAEYAMRAAGVMVKETKRLMQRRGNDDECELAHDVADQSRDERQRKEHDNVDQRDREGREADLVSSLQCRSSFVLPRLPDAGRCSPAPRSSHRPGCRRQATVPGASSGSA